MILRGGKEALSSNRALAALVREALVTGSARRGLSVCRQSLTAGFCWRCFSQSGLIDLCIPRGGEALIRFVVEHARIPVVQHYQGICHLFVDESADLTMATELVYNGKCSRPGCAMRWSVF